MLTLLVFLLVNLNLCMCVTRFHFPGGVSDVRSCACSRPLGLKVAVHRHGCCVLQRCLDAAGPNLRIKLIDEVILLDLAPLDLYLHLHFQPGQLESNRKAFVLSSVSNLECRLVFRLSWRSQIDTVA